MLHFPKINLPTEAVPHAKRLEDLAREQERVNAEFRAFMARLDRNNAAGARQTAVINNKQFESSSTSRGLPDGDRDGLVLRTTDTRRPFWSGELIDQAVTYFVGLGTGQSYIETYAGNSNTKVPIPTVGVISADELTMNAIQTPFNDQRPINLELALFPSSDLEEFEVWLPAGDNDWGNTAPYWSLHLINMSTTHRARVLVADTKLMYAGTNIPVLGSGNQWDLDPEFEGGWVVQQGHRMYGATVATPQTIPPDVFGYTGGPLVWDKWFVENVRGRSHSFEFTKTGALSTGVLPQKFYNDTPSTQYITLARATVGTAPSGSALTVDIKVDGVTAFTTTVAAAATTATATPAAQPWPVNADVDFFAVDWPAGSYVTVEVTATGSASDLTVQVWAG